MTGIPIMPCDMPPHTKTLSIAEVERRIGMVYMIQDVDSRVLKAVNDGDRVDINWFQDFIQMPDPECGGMWLHEPYGPLHIDIRIYNKAK